MTRHKRAREQGDVWKAPRRSSTEAYQASVAAPPPQSEPPRSRHDAASLGISLVEAEVSPLSAAMTQLHADGVYDDAKARQTDAS